MIDSTINGNTTKKSDSEFYDFITLDTLDAMGCSFFFLMHIFLLHSAKSPHSGEGVIYVFMPAKPYCYVYAYFDDYVLCFRNWIWAISAFSLWHLTKRNCKADRSTLKDPFINRIILFTQPNILHT